MRRTLWGLLALALLLAACAPADLLNPPRLTITPSAPTPLPVATLPPVAGPSPTPGTGELGGGSRNVNPSVTVWINETSEAHRAALNAIGAGFTAASDIHVEFLLIADDQLPGLVRTAVLSDTLPDLILHPLVYSVGWAAEGILDPLSAGAALANLDPATFDRDTLALISGANGPSALPSDGFKQFIIYRTDWFAEAELPPPNSYDDLLNAAATLHFTPTLKAGIVVPTEAGLVATQSVFEQMATANGCRLVDPSGQVVFDEPACLDSLTYYRDLINRYSPSDVQTEISALNAYLGDRAGIIFTTPRSLPALAGLDPDLLARCTVCDPANFLLENSAIRTEFYGRDREAPPTVYSDLTLLGITTSANREAALAFARYWFTDGYLTWLAVEPAHKTPLRHSTPTTPGSYLEAWRNLPLTPGGPSLVDLLGDDVVDQLSLGLAPVDRWGYGVGQGALMTRLADDFTLPILLQEMLSGYFNSEQSVTEAMRRIVALIPDYPFPLPEEAPDE